MESSNDFALLMINKMIQTFEQSFLVDIDASNNGYARKKCEKKFGKKISKKRKIFKKSIL